jgi:hypothetical protein
LSQIADALPLHGNPGKTLTIDVARSTSIQAVRSIIDDSERVPPDMQRLIFSGRQLEEGTLQDYGIQNHDSICLVMRLRGQGTISSGIFAASSDAHTHAIFFL